MIKIKSSSKQCPNRIVEIDSFRGIALVLMMLFHFLYDLKEFYNISIPYWEEFWYYEGKLSAILFMLLAGISCTLSKNNIKRGFKVFLIGMILTVASYIFMPKEYIRFGILHLLGSSMIIYPFIKNLPSIYTFLSSLVIIILGNMFSDITMNTWILIPFGITSRSFISMDYYPLLPWLGVFLIGTILGKIFYKEKKSIINKWCSNNIFTFLGRHSLIIYLSHQPIFLVFLYLIFN